MCRGPRHDKIVPKEPKCLVDSLGIDVLPRSTRGVRVSRATVRVATYLLGYFDALHRNMSHSSRKMILCAIMLH